MHHPSGIRLLDCSRVAENWKNYDGVIFYRHEVIVKLVLMPSYFEVKFRYRFNFHVNIIIGPEIMIIFIHKELDQTSGN